MTMDEAIDVLPEARAWRGRVVRYFAGEWTLLRSLVPEFEPAAFCSQPDGPANPRLNAVMRLPLTPTERRIPVGVVSKSYELIQHRTLGDICIRSLQDLGFDTKSLRCEVGLSELGEWMNLRIRLPEVCSLSPADGRPVELRLEVYNSVDGSSRLIVLLSWFRLICSNGMGVRDTLVEFSSTHAMAVDPERIRIAIASGIEAAHHDALRLERWERSPVRRPEMVAWADERVAERWGKKAATRVLQICISGQDVKLCDPFEGGKPSERKVCPTAPVPGAATPSVNLYDVAQALAWVATGRANAEQRREWQQDVPGLVHKLAKACEGLDAD